MNYLNPSTSDFDPVGSSFTNQVEEVHDGKVLQARETGNITVVNTVLHPRPRQIEIDRPTSPPDQGAAS